MTLPPLMRRLQPALTGLLLVLAAPPFDLYFLAWVGILPLLLSLRDEPDRAFGNGFLAGFVFAAGMFYWLALNVGTSWISASLSMIVAAMAIALGWGVAAKLFAITFQRVGWRAWLAVPVSWTAWEGWLGNLGEIAFPWPLVALTQNGFDPILQIMEFTGVWGVTFWVVLLNVAILFIWKYEHPSMRRLGFVIFIPLVLIPIFAEWHSYSYYKAKLPTVRVMVAQGNVLPHDKWAKGGDYSYSRYDSLTREGAKLGIDLAVWPETAIPENLLYHSVINGQLSRLADETGVFILTGASDYTRYKGESKPLNGAFLIAPNAGVVDRCAKRQLVPLGERVPLQRVIPSLSKINLGQAEFLPGQRPVVFSVPVGNDTLRFPALICFESAFPSLTARLVNRGANFLTTISNDAWYDRSTEPAQISALSRFRSIETRRAMARASNSGISFLCDHLGRIIAETKLYQMTWIAAELPLCTTRTLYVRYPDWLLFVTTTAYGIYLLYALLRRQELKS